MARIRAAEDVGPSPEANHRGWLKLLALLGLLATAVGLFYFFGGSLSLRSLAEREDQLRRWYEQRPLPTLLAALVAYTVVTGLSLPGAAVLSIVYGWLFGFWPALLVVSFGSTAGATLAFLLSRYLLRDWVQRRFGARLAAFHEAVEREGAFYLFTLRLIPQAPFFVVNLIMGLTRLPVRTFWWVSQLGMLPGTCVYVFAGASLPSLSSIADRKLSEIVSPQLLLALTLLGLFPLLVRLVMKRWQRKQPSA